MLREGTAEYERIANRLARSHIAIAQCKKCGHPHVDGYCCPACGDASPDMTPAEEARHADGVRYIVATKGVKYGI